MLLVGCLMLPLAFALLGLAVAVGAQWWPSLIIAPAALVALARYLTPAQRSARARR